MYMSGVQHVHMKEVTLTELRRNIFRLVDEALETGEPIVVKRKGRRLVIRDADRGPLETEEERRARWDAFWNEPTPPEWQDFDLSFEALDRASKEYWKWDGESELDR